MKDAAREPGIRAHGLAVRDRAIGLCPRTNAAPVVDVASADAIEFVVAQDFGIEFGLGHLRHPFAGRSSAAPLLTDGSCGDPGSRSRVQLASVICVTLKEKQVPGPFNNRLLPFGFPEWLLFQGPQSCESRFLVRLCGPHDKARKRHRTDFSILRPVTVH